MVKRDPKWKPCTAPDCGKIMVPQRLWHTLTNKAKAEWRLQGYERKAGRGLCATHYGRIVRKEETPDNRERRRRIMKARSKALTRLTGLHPHDFEIIYQEELRKEGVADVDMRGMRHAG